MSRAEWRRKHTISISSAINSGMAASLDHLNSQSFKEQLHSKFQVHAAGSAPLTLELIAVEEPTTTPSIELFCLLFLGPTAPILRQQTWGFSHAKLGSLELFMTARSSGPEGTTYEVVFNRVRKKQP